MLFNSLSYAVFLPIVFALYWALPHKFRWPFLLAASYYFYMNWNPKYVVLIFATTFISYSAALLLERQQSVRKKKAILIFAGIVCLGILFFFKYFNFTMEIIAGVMNLFFFKFSPVTLKFLLPVGISFYTFQTLSYVIDVYRGKLKAEHHFGVYATFISFFPQLVAGPIERSSNLLPQITSEKKFDYKEATYGLKLMAWGFFKKLAIADVISAYVDQGFADISKCTGFDLALVIFFVVIQIYCDFSGYSDIAIGTARLFGIRLMTNFRSPFFSISDKDFWRKWHISLSTWFRDYIYIPLGGSKCSKPRTYLNLMITFLASGLWHGANITFVIWGGLHGALQVVERALKLDEKKRSRLSCVLSGLFVFLYTSLSFVFFRAQSLHDAFEVLGHLALSFQNLSTFLHTSFGFSIPQLAVIFLTIFALAVFDYLNQKQDVILAISNKHWLVRWSFYVALVVCTCLIYENMAVSDASFVYFQF